MTGKEFFKVSTVEDALAALFAQWQPQPRLQRMATRSAAGRRLARAVHSPIDLPEFTRSSMDGYALRAADTFGASASLPAYLNCVGVLRMGTAPDIELQPGEAAEIYTGAQIPSGADAVVMVEKTQRLGDREIEVLAPVAPGENLVQIGEDVRAGEMILAAGHCLRPQDIGGLLAVGVLEVDVAAAPRVALVGSGDELVPPECAPAPGQIRDINTYTIAALAEACGAELITGGIAADDFDALFGLAQAALAQADILVISAGSSVSTRDLTCEVIGKLGSPGVIQHGLAVKPGKPTLLGVCDGKAVIGLPGNPVSALLVARQILIPAIRHAMGEAPRPAGTVRAALSANIASSSGRLDTVPVRLLREDGQLLAEPLFGKSNLIYTLVRADGLVEVPLNSGGLKAGATVEVILF